MGFLNTELWKLNTIFPCRFCFVAFTAERLPVGWIVEQVRTIGRSLNVIELCRFGRFALLQAFRAQSVFGVGIKPRLSRTSVRTAAAETSRFGRSSAS
jgi:hypothetical protein